MPDGIDKLTAAVAGGDEAAVEAFYRRYFDRLYSQARRATGRDEAFCLDVVQEAILRVIRSLRPVADEAELMAWLGLVVRTTAYDLLRADRRRRDREEAFAAAGATRGRADDVACNSGGEDDERLAWLRAELATLDPELLRIIELRYEQRWTLQRIGALLGLSTGTVDGRLRRALKGLRGRAPAPLVEGHDV